MHAAAFRKSEATLRLENYAPVIVEHLALVTWYPDSRANKHWEIELEAFCAALSRYKKGKKSRQNFDHKDIVDELEAAIELNDDKDHLLLAIQSHGEKPPNNPNWDELKAAISQFADQVLH